MFVCECDLIGVSPLSFGAVVRSTKQTSEKPDDFEARTWRERIHADASGEVFIPPMALKNCLSEVAQYIGESVPGKGNAKYTKHFTSGIQVMDPLMLGIKASDVVGERFFVPSDGKRGGGKRVWKTFPVIGSWRTSGQIYVFDPVIKPDKVLEYLRHAGKFIGLGRFRPSRNGFYGRFKVDNFTHHEGP